MEILVRGPTLFCCIVECNRRGFAYFIFYHDRRAALQTHCTRIPCWFHARQGEKLNQLLVHSRYQYHIITPLPTGDGPRRRISECAVQAQPAHLSAPFHRPSGCAKPSRLSCAGYQCDWYCSWRKLQQVHSAAAAVSPRLCLVLRCLPNKNNCSCHELLLLKIQCHRVDA